MSDLHLEYDAAAASANRWPAREAGSAFYRQPPQPDADVLVLAGDIHEGTKAIDWALRNFAVPTVLIMGNHEPFGGELFRLIARARRAGAATNGRVNFLERASWTYRSPSGEVARFIGATLWTDFELYGTAQLSMAIAGERLDDFKDIRIERGYKLRALRPPDTVRLHMASLVFLRRELARPFEGLTIVVTHHAPSARSISPSFQGNALNPAFASNLDGVIREFAPSLWIHGHMHESFDYAIGATRIICNPRGYFPDQLNPRFNSSLVVEIP